MDKKLFFTKIMLLITILAFCMLTGCGKKESKVKFDFESAIRNEQSKTMDTVESDNKNIEEEASDAEIPEMEGFDYVKLEKKGKIVNTLMGDFDREYYDKNQLETFILSEVSDFNRDKGENLIEVDTVKISGDEAKVVLEFKDIASFEEFNQQEFFYGTIAEAIAAGYSLNTDYTDKNGEQIHADEALKKEKRMMVISRSDRDRLNIITPKKILYTGGMASFESKNEAIAMPGGVSIIILK